jgi:hypothetical protein
MGKIQIKEQNKGKFTNWASSHGMSVQEAASYVLRNRERFSSTLIKRANFARNAARWEDGGQQGDPTFDRPVSSSFEVNNNIPTRYTASQWGNLAAKKGYLGDIGPTSLDTLSAVNAFTKLPADKMATYSHPNEGMPITYDPRNPSANPNGFVFWNMERMPVSNPASLTPSVSRYTKAMDRNVLATKEDGGIIEYKKGGIHINPANKGKFTATKKSTGKTTEELTHSKNPLTRKRAIFAQNAKKWKHEDGGMQTAQEIQDANAFQSFQKNTAKAIPGAQWVSPIAGGITDIVDTKDEYGASKEWSSAFRGAVDPSMGLSRSVANAKSGNFGMGTFLDFNVPIAGEVWHNREAMSKRGDTHVNKFAMQNPTPNATGSTFKFGGQFKGKLFGKGGTANALVQDGEIILNPSGRIETASNPSAPGVDNIPVNFATGTRIINAKDSKPLLKYVNKYNKGGQKFTPGITSITKNTIQLNNKYYQDLLNNAYSNQEAEKTLKRAFKKGGEMARFSGAGKYIGPDYYKNYVETRTAANQSWQMPDPNPFPQGSYLHTNQLPNVNVVSSVTPKTIDIQAGEKYKAPSSGIANGSYSNEFNMATDPRFGSFEHVNEAPMSGAPIKNITPTNTTSLAPMTNYNNTKNNTYPGAKESFGGTNWSKAGSTAASLAPAIVNLIGALSKTEKTPTQHNSYANLINSIMANRQYNIDAALAANQASYATARRNINNLAGPGGRSNVAAALNQKQFADMALYGQKSNMDNQYAGERANMLYGLGRDQAGYNTMADEANAMNRATRRNYLNAAATGLQNYTLTNRQMQNEVNRDKLLYSAVQGYSPYTNKWVSGLEPWMKYQSKNYGA